MNESHVQKAAKETACAGPCLCTFDQPGDGKVSLRIAFGLRDPENPPVYRSFCASDCALEYMHALDATLAVGTRSGSLPRRMDEFLVIVDHLVDQARGMSGQRDHLN